MPRVGFLGCQYIKYKTMREKIIESLRQLEKEKDIKILLAVESGSRAWGFSSSDSDYDVRFIYAHKPDWYLSVFPKKDVIERMIGNHLLDMSGWELRKTLQLLYKSNPNLADWLLTDQIYISEPEFLAEIRDMQSRYYNPIQAMYHFLSIAKKHDEKYLSKNGFTLKRFLYFLRGLLACEYIEAQKTHPPVEFERLVDATVKDQSQKQEIRKIIELKRISKESDNVIIDENLMNYALILFEKHKAGIAFFRPELQPHDSNPLDQMFRKWVTAWSEIS